MENLVAPDEKADSSCGRYIASPSEYVKLNVGGALFQTTIATLTKQDSMLRAMFSGRMDVLTDCNGWVLIDRCGKHFGVILNFLRDGSVALPDCRVETMEIMAEAKFYLLQELVQHCQDWLKTIAKEVLEPHDVCMIPFIYNLRDRDRIVESTSKPIIVLLLNRHNNKYSYTMQSDDNLLKNLELFDRLVQRFNERIFFFRDSGLGCSEVCQWTFYGEREKKAEICCTSIVYATDKKHTKVEFPEARIYEETLNILLYEERHVCKKCNECGNCLPTRSRPISHLQIPSLTACAHNSSGGSQTCSTPSFNPR